MDGESTVLVGLGSPILSDDAVGPTVAEAVRAALPPDAPVDVIEAAVGGFELVELIVGYGRAIIIDAIRTEGGRPGDFYIIDPHDLRLPDVPGMTHQVGLLEGLEAGRRLGLAVPTRVRIYAVEAADTLTFSTTMTPAVENAVPKVLQAILATEFHLTSTAASVRSD